MNSNRGESQPNFELPKPAPERSDEGTEQGQEAPPSHQEKLANRPQAPALPAIPADIPTTDQPVIPSSQDELNQPPAAHPAIPDSDHISNEWVDKVKNVASQTRDDPFAQKHHVSQIKAEYIRKRFNKTIKPDEPGS